MTNIVRSIPAAYLAPGRKWLDTARLEFDLNAPVSRETAEAHLTIMQPKGLVVSVPVKRGKNGGFVKKARFFRSGERLYPIYPSKMGTVTWHIVVRVVPTKEQEAAGKVVKDYRAAHPQITAMWVDEAATFPAKFFTRNT